MAEKTAAEGQQIEKEPDFKDVEFEGEDNSHLDTGKDEGGGEGGDERIGEREGVAVEGERAGETDDEKRTRRREERAQKKVRQRQERDENKTLKAEVARLARTVEELGGNVSTRIAGVEKNVTATSLQAIDGRLDVLRRMYANAEGSYDKAFTEGNAVDSRKAADVMADAKAEYARLVEQRKAVVASGSGGSDGHGARETGKQEQQRPDPRIERFATAFMDEFPDYDPNGRDTESKIVQAIDEALTEEMGEAATRTQAYWDELTERVRERIPEWDGDAPKRGANGNSRRSPVNGARNRPRQTVAGSGRENGGEGSGGAKWVLKADRIQALKDAGKWDDLKARDKAIRAFQKWDKENPQQRSA